MQLLSEDIKSIIMVNLMPSNKVCAIGPSDVEDRDGTTKRIHAPEYNSGSKGSSRVLGVCWLIG